VRDKLRLWGTDHPKNEIRSYQATEESRSTAVIFAGDEDYASFPDPPQFPKERDNLATLGKKHVLASMCTSLLTFPSAKDG